MRKVWRRIVQFLRDPAVETSIAVIMLTILVSGGIAGWFEGLSAWVLRNAPWLAGTTAWPNWLSIVVIALLFFFTVSTIRNVFRKRRFASRIPFRSILYHEIWGVIWGWPPPKGWYIADGPLCPQHKIPVDINEKISTKGEHWYEFFCPGEEGGEAHTIKGPMFSQLIGSKGYGRGDVNIYKDVNARLRSIDLKKNV